MGGGRFEDIDRVAVVLDGVLLRNVHSYIRTVSCFVGMGAFTAWVYHTIILSCCCPQHSPSRALSMHMSAGRKVWSPLLGAEVSSRSYMYSMHVGFR
jgi:hypothetical protein